MLKTKFQKLCHLFSTDEKLIKKLYKEIETYHTETTRYYHNLNHLITLYALLDDIGLSPIDEFAIFYHDIIYDIREKENEEQSALLAQKRLHELTLPHPMIQEVCALIRESKTHKSSNPHHHAFLDADLAILGTHFENYQRYAKAVRQEYQIYDDTNYALGRQKVLKYFLEKPNLYLTEHFHEQYEEQARSNLEWELKSLN
ncbi:MAG TPA: hypothetical protein ENK82_04475 [Campylobacterales bacterium]|nr:hypothetical protein [Campylobacterales bacterium]HHS92579.1 hypothetical protein [Campylobacterales bacterium]